MRSGRGARRDDGVRELRSTPRTIRADATRQYVACRQDCIRRQAEAAAAGTTNHESEHRRSAVNRSGSARWSMRLAGCMDSTWCASFGQLSRPYSRASACCAASFTDGSAARSVLRWSLARLRSCSSDGRSGRCRRADTDMTISFRISPASARRAERRSRIVTAPMSGGPSPSRGRDASCDASLFYAPCHGRDQWTDVMAPAPSTAAAAGTAKARMACLTGRRAAVLSLNHLWEQRKPASCCLARSTC